MNTFNNIIYSNAPITKYHNQFYGAYSDLNKINYPSDKSIRNLQLTKIKQFQKKSLKDNNKTRKINSFLKLNGKFSTSQDEFDKIINGYVDDLFGQINQLISSGVMSKKYREEITISKKKEQEIITKLTTLGNTIKQLSTKINQPIQSKYINQLMNLIDGLPSGDLDLVLRTLYHLKGDILEETGIAWLNERIPQKLQVKAVNVGGVRNNSSGQLIQDIMIFDLDLVDLFEDIEISFEVNKQKKNLKLKDFLKEIETYNGNKDIVINNETQSFLNSLSAFNIQAKSGAEQLPWNISSKNTYVSIRGGIGSKVEQYIYFLDKLQYLYNIWDQSEKNIKKRSDVYEAMGNYSLSTQLDKVLHLSKLDNQYLLTPSGFVTYTERIMELYEKRKTNKYLFRFKGYVDLNKNGINIVDVARPVIMFDKDKKI